MIEQLPHDPSEFLAERLVSYKLPRTVEYVSEALRDDAGKVRRSARIGVSERWMPEVFPASRCSVRRVIFSSTSA